MKLSTLAAFGIAMLAITGCATNAVIADLEEDKVIVQATGNDQAVINAEAAKGCGIHGKRPVAISFTCMDQYCIGKRHLFACKA